MPKRKQDERVASCPQGLEPPPLSSDTTSEHPRRVLPNFNSLESLLDLLRTCKKVVVITGAGISVSCGIPDFRSENGVYDLVSRLDLGLSCAEDLFDLEFFTDNPEPFFKFAKVLYPGEYTPSRTHRFIKELELRGKLLRNFTQNIDGLEAQVGLKKYIACHGSFLKASCLKCKKKRTAEDIREDVMRQQIPRCPSCGGVVKPDITFFGEKLPGSVKRAVEADHKKADLLLVLGTSLKVQPVSRILQHIPRHIPQVLVNRELIRPPKKISDGFDLHLLGDSDDVIEHLCDRLGWELPPASPPPAEARQPSPPTTAKTATPLSSPVVETPPVSPKAEGAGSPSRRPSSPTFVPPNSYLFNSSAGGSKKSGGVSSSAWAALSGVDERRVREGGGAEDFEEVVTCDGCDEVVVGEVYACVQCFGYDLCKLCYGGGINNHARRTGHSFQLSN